ncbi:Uncharacterized protein dnm_066940 [Desulfonema magnum]|uniref:Uncharacterized protein n=1 Tax=Desulfonema magnum TaxID=45655 RepID=A0A975BSJ9_9BACT|nr:Uncharacterized protein dnm_066940 [Desulfonema magnum]
MWRKDYFATAGENSFPIHNFPSDDAHTILTDKLLNRRFTPD